MTSISNYRSRQTSGGAFPSGMSGCGSRGTADFLTPSISSISRTLLRSLRRHSRCRPRASVYSTHCNRRTYQRNSKQNDVDKGCFSARFMRRQFAASDRHKPPHRCFEQDIHPRRDMPPATRHPVTYTDDGDEELMNRKARPACPRSRAA